MNDVKLETEYLKKELDNLYEQINDNMQINDKCVEEESILNILSINDEIIDNLNKLG